jgi:crotonobetainyl-CoA:carnitine CoA-transferase CaiB-like acyl-CoA transferase
MFADGGADVVKIESAAFPDGSRQSYLPYGLSASFAAGHRNKRSLGLDLRQEDGRALFLDLVREADVLLSNFKPGTLDSLGLDAATLAAINPRLVMTDSSAFGPTGPWAKRLGYGPLVRAVTGLTHMWRYPGDPESFSDAVTVYPDHVAGRISALGALALLVRRERTGRGGSASVSQAEVMLAQFAAYLSPDRRSEQVSAVFPTAGDDAWCVVTVDADENDLADIATAIAGRDAMAAAKELQAKGIAAAPMLRVAELTDFPYYRERDSFRIDEHPYLAEPVISERHAARFLSESCPPWGPAPLAGEQSIDIVRAWLGMSDAETGRLIEAHILQPTGDEVFETVREHLHGRARTSS